jgi:hypothetical protein
MIMSEDMRPEGRMIIQIGLSFGIPHIGALASDKYDFRLYDPVY